MSPLEVYFWLKLDTFIKASIPFGVLFGFGTVVTLIGWLVNKVGNEPDPKNARIFKYLFLPTAPLFLILLIISIFLPTTKEYAVIYALPKIVNNQEVQQLPKDALKLLRLKMDKWLEEMQMDITKEDKQ